MNTVLFGPAPNDDLRELSGNTCGHEEPVELQNLLQLMESFKALSETGSGDINSKSFEVIVHKYCIGRFIGYVFRILFLLMVCIQ